MKTSRPINQPSGFTLIELLVVITIIALLAGMAFPVINGVMNKARKVKTQSIIKDLQVAIKGYQTEYNRYPADASEEDVTEQTNSSSTLIPILLAADSQQGQGGKNPRGIKFIDLAMAKNGRGGLLGQGSDNYQLVDEWGQPYTVIMDTNGDEKIKNPDLQNDDPKVSSGAPPELPLGVGVYSFGPDGITKKTPTKDDVTSWRS